LDSSWHFLCCWFERLRSAVFNGLYFNAYEHVYSPNKAVRQTERQICISEPHSINMSCTAIKQLSGVRRHQFQLPNCIYKYTAYTPVLDFKDIFLDWFFFLLCTAINFNFILCRPTVTYRYVLQLEMLLRLYVYMCTCTSTYFGFIFCTAICVCSLISAIKLDLLTYLVLRGLPMTNTLDSISLGQKHTLICHADVSIRFPSKLHKF